MIQKNIIEKIKLNAVIIISDPYDAKTNKKQVTQKTRLM
tara:strand:+ start:4760 stop:4876 length:117 start_codon:yes stop_codon:yes gene_type:complete